MKHNINIGMVVDGYYPADIRVRKEAESLAEYFNVFVLCIKGENEPDFEVINKVSICRRIVYKSLNQKGLVDVFVAMRFQHPLFKKTLPIFIENNSIGTLHVHDLPLAETVYQAAIKFNLHKTIDLHENYPEALKTWFSWRKSPLIRLKNKLFFNYKRWSKYEAGILPKFDTIIAVVEEMKQRIIAKNKISSSKIIVVTNTEKKTFSKYYSDNKKKVFSTYKDKCIISYIGGIGPHRGLQTAIKGIAEIKKEIPNILLVIVGPAHSDVFTHLQKIVKDEKVEKEVVFLGKQDFSIIPEMMQTSEINIIPHERNTHTDNTIPHKLFQILMSGKPLLVSDAKPLKRVVESSQIGWVFEAGNPHSFAQQVIYIHKSPELAKTKAVKGKTLCIEGDLNWEYTARTLISFYKNSTL